MLGDLGVGDALVVDHEPLEQRLVPLAAQVTWRGEVGEDLAELYGVETRVLVQQVRRNEKRFPADFMFQLSTEEFSNLKSQFVISSGGHGGRRKRPLVFTEQGVAMLSGVLRSDRAVAVNIEIMRAFVELRRVAGSFDELQKRLDQMELDIGARLSEHDEQLARVTSSRAVGQRLVPVQIPSG